MSKSKFKAMLIVFFDINGIVMTEWVPEGQTVNQIYYLSVLATLRERVRKKRPELWKNNSWILHQDNVPAHNALYVKQYLAGKRTPVLEHAPYSPDLAPCDFFLFPKIKSALKGTRFESMEAVKQKTAELLKALTKEDFQHCFDQWKKRIEKCMARGGDTLKNFFKGNSIKVRGLFALLPDETVILLLSLVDVDMFLNCRLVCKRSRALSDTYIFQDKASQENEFVNNGKGYYSFSKIDSDIVRRLDFP
ncbi:Transposase, type 1 [Cinara cedri]|uniref:Transposase, type 1 n=1 Tax=Cinara cedri TaxID=506608 RepID=A0A5E4NIB4_9HEMI|nr:Transposase, type 1 [Cinara cedri]